MTTFVPFSERLLLADRVIYVTVAALLAWFVFEVRIYFILFIMKVVQKYT